MKENMQNSKHFIGDLISESFSIFSKMCQIPNENMLRILIWHIYLEMEPKWKTIGDTLFRGISLRIVIYIFWKI